MVRINLINPKKLADQHLIAEYNEILMLLGYVKKYPRLTNIPEGYALGKGHIRFFKNKLLYLKRRHEILKIEMKKRGFATNIVINLDRFSNELINDWQPKARDYEVIKKRLIEKFHLKPNYYKYYKEYKDKEFFIGLLR